MISKRTSEMTSFIVMDVLEKAHEMERDGIDIVHLEVGEPDFDTPQCVKDAACKALTDGHTHYTHSLGMIELREAISVFYHNTYKVDLDPERIVITSGTSPAMFALFSSLLEKGDEVIISDPHYACYVVSLVMLRVFYSSHLILLILFLKILKLHIILLIIDI